MDETRASTHMDALEKIAVEVIRPAAVEIDQTGMFPRAAMRAETPDALLDAGESGCGELVMLIAQHMKALPPNAVLEVRAYDLAAAVDIAAWCRMTGTGCWNRILIRNLIAF